MHPPITVIDYVAKPELKCLTFYYSPVINPDASTSSDSMSIRFCLIQGIDSVYGGSIDSRTRSKTTLFRFLRGCHIWAYLVPGKNPASSVFVPVSREYIKAVRVVRITVDNGSYVLK